MTTRITHESILAEIGRILDLRLPIQSRPKVPIDPFIVRWRLGRSVADRIRGFYPHGIEEGMIVRGYFRKPMSWRRAKRCMERGRTVYRFRERSGRIYDGVIHGPYPNEREKVEAWLEGRR